ncbi:MAG: hypothetical protein P8N18_03700 [Hellea sp.]|nr:hypothetical protein [Hellea sp.]
MKIADKALLVSITLFLLVLSGCTAKDKSNDPSAKKSTPIHNNINNAKDFGKYFILEKRKISHSEFNDVLKKILEINPSLMANSLSAPRNSDGNFIFNEPNLNEFFNVNQIKLQGAHIQEGELYFDRIDLSGIKIKNSSNETLSFKKITIISPKLETVRLILLALHDKKIKQSNFKINDILKQGGKALAIEDFSVSAKQGALSIGSIIWGRDQKQEISDFQVMNIEFYGKDNLGNVIEASLSSSTVMGISEKVLQNFSSTLNLENMYSNFFDSTFILYDSIDVNDLHLKSEYATLKTESFTGRQKAKSGIVKNRYSGSPITIELKNPPPAKEAARAFEAIKKIGYSKITLQFSQESELNINNDTLKINNGSISLNDGFDLSYNYSISNLNNLKDIKNVSLDGFQLRFDDNSILERVINYYAAEVRKTTPDKIKKELATVLTLAPIMTKGLASELTGELSSELIKLVNGGGTISIIMQPKKPINLSVLTDLQNAERSKEEIGFSVKAE